MLVARVVLEAAEEYVEEKGRLGSRHEHTPLVSGLKQPHMARGEESTLTQWPSCSAVARRRCGPLIFDRAL